MYALTKVLEYILQPMVTLLIIGGLGLVLSLFRNRWGSRLMGAVIFLLFFLLCLPFSDWALRPLEERFPPMKMPAHVDGIIAIGGWINLSTTEDRQSVVLRSGAEALFETVVLARHYPSARVVYAGGSSYPDRTQLREADVAHYLFDALGIDQSRITYERRSRNTHENALFARDLAHPQPGEVWLLVAPASDIPRDVGSFRGVGWPVIGWPAGYRTERESDIIGLPGNGSIGELGLAMHEWAGLVYYHLRGWTDAWFPAPESPTDPITPTKGTQPHD